MPSAAVFCLVGRCSSAQFGPVRVGSGQTAAPVLLHPDQSKSSCREHLTSRQMADAAADFPGPAIVRRRVARRMACDSKAGAGAQPPHADDCRPRGADARQHRRPGVPRCSTGPGPELENKRLVRRVAGRRPRDAGDPSLVSSNAGGSSAAPPDPRRRGRCHIHLLAEVGCAGGSSSGGHGDQLSAQRRAAAEGPRSPGPRDDQSWRRVPRTSGALKTRWRRRPGRARGR
jgi:hypothetical protein